MWLQPKGSKSSVTPRFAAARVTRNCAVRSDSMSAVVILAQIRSLVADLMQLSGMEYLEARELIPDRTDGFRSHGVSGARLR
jgi:hypothetical protein